MWTPPGDLRPNLPTLPSPLWLQQLLTVARGGRCFWRRLFPEKIALPGELWPLPPQAPLRVCSDSRSCSGTLGSRCRVFLLVAAPQKLGYLSSSFLSPYNQPGHLSHLSTRRFWGQVSSLQARVSPRSFPTVSGQWKSSEFPVNLQEAVGGMGEQLPLWGAGMGTDLSLGHHREPRTEGKSRERAAAPSSFSSSSRTEVHRRERM